VTALVVVGIFVLILVVVIGGWLAYVRSLANGVLAQSVKTQRTLILEIEEKAMNYGYTDPLAYDIIQTIRDARKKENSK
jgi:hypothetical protein